MTTLPLLYNDLLGACQLPGCPVCRLVQDEVRRYLAALFYDAVNDIPLREQLRRSRGFCRDHAWLALQPGVGDALGLAIIYHDVFTNILRRYPDVPSGGGAAGGLAALFKRAPRGLVEAGRSLIAALRPQAPCPGCVHEAQNNRLVIADLLLALNQEELLLALTASDGLCLPHLAGSLEAAQSGEAIKALLSASQYRLAELDTELAEFIRKNDYRFRDEAMGGERDAWRRAVRLAVGEHPWIEK